MPEPNAERIAQALVDLLAGIVGDDGASYWYTPGAVRLVDAIGAACLDETFADASSGKATIYALEPDGITTEGETTHEIDAAASYLLLVAHQIDQSDHPMKAPAGDSRHTVQSRLDSDVRKAIHSDPTLGGLCHYVEVLETERSPRELYVEGWAAVMFRLALHYSYWKSQP